MAQKGVDLETENVTCSICLELLKDPVTIPCGHSYCLACIQGCWDGVDGVVSQDREVSCPQCRQTFRPQPVLVKNIVIAAVVEQLEKTGLRAATAAAEDHVTCEVCTGRKVKACKSCLVCVVSYCEEHLQPHYHVAALKKHQLVDPCHSLQEMVCSRHDEVMKLFCRTDQQTICSLCSLDDHRGHHTVSAAAERTEKQKELQRRREEIQRGIQNREEEVKLLQQQAEAMEERAEESVEASEKMLDEMILLLQRRRSEVKQRIRSEQEAEVRKVRELEEKLQQEIWELKRTDAELQQLAHTHHHTHFLRNFPSVTQLGASAPWSSVPRRPLGYFEAVTAAVSELRDKLRDVLGDAWTNVFQAHMDKVPLSTPQPLTRDQFITCSRHVTLDPNTAAQRLVLSDGNRKVTNVWKSQNYPDHPERFTRYYQVLSRESLTGRCYWEVKWSGNWIDVSVSYKNISRADYFGADDKSWVLICDNKGFTFRHNKTETRLPAGGSSRIGVYLDHSAGILSFYSVSDSMTLLHSVHTTFTQPLYAGFYLHTNAHAEFTKL